MIQSQDCEFYEASEDGRRTFKCDPFTNIKEPQCLAKWELLKLEMLVTSYRHLLEFQQKMGPMQDKIFKYVKRELDDLDEADSWKLDNTDEDPDDQPL